MVKPHFHESGNLFLSGYARQPEVELLHPWAVAFAEIYGQMVSLRLNTLSNTNLVAFEA